MEINANMYDLNMEKEKFIDDMKKIFVIS